MVFSCVFSLADESAKFWNAAIPATFTLLNMPTETSVKVEGLKVPIKPSSEIKIKVDFLQPKTYYRVIVKTEKRCSLFHLSPEQTPTISYNDMGDIPENGICDSQHPKFYQKSLERIAKGLPTYARVLEDSKEASPSLPLTAAEGVAILEVWMPSESKLYIQDTEIVSSGTHRIFINESLEAGKSYSVKLRFYHYADTTKYQNVLIQNHCNSYTSSWQPIIERVTLFDRQYVEKVSKGTHVGLISMDHSYAYLVRPDETKKTPSLAKAPDAAPKAIVPIPAPAILPDTLPEPPVVVKEPVPAPRTIVRDDPPKSVPSASVPAPSVPSPKILDTAQGTQLVIEVPKNALIMVDDRALAVTPEEKRVVYFPTLATGAEKTIWVKVRAEDAPEVKEVKVLLTGGKSQQINMLR